MGHKLGSILFQKSRVYYTRKVSMSLIFDVPNQHPPAQDGFITSNLGKRTLGGNGVETTDRSASLLPKTFTSKKRKEKKKLILYAEDEEFFLRVVERFSGRRIQFQISNCRFMVERLRAIFSPLSSKNF